jgi:hypothetical protein
MSVVGKSSKWKVKAGTETQRQAIQHGCLHSSLGDVDKCSEKVYNE